MTALENTALIRRWLEMADSGFAGDFDDFFTTDYSGHLSGRIHMDLTELQRLEREFAAAFSEANRTVEDLWGLGDKVVLASRPAQGTRVTPTAYWQRAA